MINLNLSHLFAGMLLISCNYPSHSQLPTPSFNPQPADSPISPKLKPSLGGQQLPITAKTTINNRVIELEVARTPQQQTIGLMYRRVLPPNRGMLFPFNPPQTTSFWMKNTLIPLDMIFIRNGKVKSIISRVPPCQKDPCPSYGPANTGELIDSVLELPAGRAEELGLKVGSKIEIQFLKNAES